MHTGLEDRPRRLPAPGRLLRRAGPRRRRPHRDRRLRPQLRGLAHAASARSWPPAARPAPTAPITDAVHAEGGKIALQILHAGRYGYHPLLGGPVAASSRPSRPSRRARCRRPGVERQIRDFARCARAGPRGRLRRRRGDGLARATSSTSSWPRAPTGAPTGGAARYENRMRFPVEIVAARPRGGGRATSSSSTASPCSTWSPDGSTWDEVVAAGPGARGGRRHHPQHRHRLARGAGADHRHHRCRARAFAWVTAQAARARWASRCCTTNRINTPEVAEEVLADGDADMVSMARPLLADPELRATRPRRAAPTRSTPASPATRPASTTSSQRKRCHLPGEPARLPRDRARLRAGRDREEARRRGRRRPGRAWPAPPRRRARPRGRRSSRPRREIGGQFNMARRIPGKEEFAETLRYFRRRIEVTGVTAAPGHAGRRRGARRRRLRRGGAGHRRRAARPAHPRAGPPDGALLRRRARAAASRSGGAWPSSAPAASASTSPSSWSTRGARRPRPRRPGWREWGVADPATARGGLADAARRPPPARQVILLQRKAAKPGAGLGKTTGWIHRAALKARKVEMLGGRELRPHRRPGPHHRLRQGAQEDPAARGGQRRPLHRPGAAARARRRRSRPPGVRVHLIGGADVAAELDAKRAIDQGTRVAARL